MLLWSDRVDFTNLRKAEWELKDPDRKNVKQTLTNQLDRSFTAAFDLSGLPSDATSWKWKGKIEDNDRTKSQVTVTITVN